MFKLDDNLLRELGLGDLPPEEKNKMLAHIYETLEMRVGMKLAEKMTNEQLDEFEGFIDKNDEAGALKWLESNFPNYKQVVAEELESLKNEIRQSAPQIMQAVYQERQQSAAYTPPPQQPVPPPSYPQQPGMQHYQTPPPSQSNSIYQFPILAARPQLPSSSHPACSCLCSPYTPCLACPPPHHPPCPPASLPTQKIFGFPTETAERCQNFLLPKPTLEFACKTWQIAAPVSLLFVCLRISFLPYSCGTP